MDCGGPAPARGTAEAGDTAFSGSAYSTMEDLTPSRPPAPVR
jgi:hypothetical protein